MPKPQKIYRTQFWANFSFNINYQLVISKEAGRSVRVGSTFKALVRQTPREAK
jgi:hypothetical protein